MKIISHRGWWISEEEKNTTKAFDHSFNSGYGTETDLRDFNGEIVISHDIPDETCMSFSCFLELYLSSHCQLPLALNIKSDGLQDKLKEILERYEVSDYFAFDMSVPDAFGYFKVSLNTFIRVSEYESINPQLLELAQGVWLDAFNKHDFNGSVFKSLLSSGKPICIVSPELHRRDYECEWNELRESLLGLSSTDNLILCTDIPFKAEEFFKNA